VTTLVVGQAKDFFAALQSKFRNENISGAYEKFINQGHGLGEYLLIDLTENISLCLVIAQKYRKNTSGEPPLSPTDLLNCLIQFSKATKTLGVNNLHMMKPSPTIPNYTWDVFEDILKTSFSKTALTIYVYTYTVNKRKFDNDDIIKDENSFLPPTKKAKSTSIFSGCVVSSYGEIENLDEIEKIIKLNGGSYRSEDEDFDFSIVSHMLTNRKWDYTLFLASQENTNCIFLDPKWIVDSSVSSKRLPEKSYEVQRSDK